MAPRKSDWSPVDATHVKVGGINGRPKKITGTRLGAVLGVNHWKTPFQAWCEITRVAEPPFEPTVYTEAGKVLEPKIVEYCREYVSPDIKTPEDIYGEDFFHKTWGDFFPDNKCFGGMWDALYYIGDDLEGVIECKTSSRPQDWSQGVPPHYLVQGQLYAYLLGLEDVYFAVSFMQRSDYDVPESFVCTEDNTVLYHEKVTDEFKRQIERAESWWDEHIHDGAVSPDFDEKRDAEYLKLMRTNEVSDASDINDVVDLLVELDARIDATMESSGLNAMNFQKKTLTDRLKTLMMESFTGNATKVVSGPYTLTKTARVTVDKKAMEKDGVLDKYAKEDVSYRLTRKKES